MMNEWKDRERERETILPLAPQVDWSPKLPNKTRQSNFKKIIIIKQYAVFAQNYQGGGGSDTKNWSDVVDDRCDDLVTIALKLN